MMDILTLILRKQMLTEMVLSIQNIQMILINLHMKKLKI